MDAKIKEQWLDALRSGKYTQGTKYLVNLDEEDKPAEYCCLGVLCALAEEAGVVTSEVENNPFNPGKRLVFGIEEGGQLVGREASVLPVPVRRWADLQGNNPVVKDPRTGHDYSIAVFNDGNSEVEQLSFLDIADMIEEQL